jgi:hypothetical protein
VDYIGVSMPVDMWKRVFTRRQDAHDAKVGIDARLISHQQATSLDAQLSAKSSKLVYPEQNLVDIFWDSRPAPSKELVYIQPIEYTGQPPAMMYPPSSSLVFRCGRAREDISASGMDLRAARMCLPCYAVKWKAYRLEGS